MGRVRRPISSTATSPPIGPICCGGRYHVYSDVGRLPLSGGGARCVQPPGRRLVDVDHLAHAGGARRPQHGALAAAAERCDPPFGSWLASSIAISMVTRCCGTTVARMSLAIGIPTG